MSKRDSSAPVYSISQNIDDGECRHEYIIAYKADLSAIVIHFIVNVLN